jgi:hypothetical protein
MRRKRAKPSSQIILHIAHELSSHLVSQAYLVYSFTSHNIYIYVVGFTWSFLGKFSPTKIL